MVGSIIYFLIGTFMCGIASNRNEEFKNSDFIKVTLLWPIVLMVALGMVVSEKAKN